MTATKNMTRLRAYHLLGLRNTFPTIKELDQALEIHPTELLAYARCLAELNRQTILSNASQPYTKRKRRSRKSKLTDAYFVKDAVYNGLIAVGIRVTPVHILPMYDDLQRIPFTAAQEYLYTFHDCRLERVTHGFVNEKGGAEFSLLRTWHGFYILQLKINNTDKDPHYHSVFYNASEGTILDDDRQLDIKDRDRASPYDARGVFNSLFYGEFKVQINNVYQLMRR